LQPAAADSEALSDTQVIHIGYNLISNTDPFELPCHDWCQKAPAAYKTITAAFQEHFFRQAPDLDRLSAATTGYHGAKNHVAATNTCPPISNAANDAELIADAVQTQVALTLAPGCPPSKSPYQLWEPNLILLDPCWKQQEPTSQ
jgi:hypothetical protein